MAQSAREPLTRSATRAAFAVRASMTWPRWIWHARTRSPLPVSWSSGAGAALRCGS